MQCPMFIVLHSRLQLFEGWINRYPVDSEVCFASTYLPVSDLSVNSIIHLQNNWSQINISRLCSGPNLLSCVLGQNTSLSCCINIQVEWVLTKCLSNLTKYRE